MPTRAITFRRSTLAYATAASPTALPEVGWSLMSGWAAPVAWWSGVAPNQSPSAPRIRYERRTDIYQTLLSFGCALICWRYQELFRQSPI